MTLKYVNQANGTHHFSTDEKTALGRAKPTITNTRLRVRHRRAEFVDLGVSITTHYVNSNRASTVVDTASMLPVDALKLAALLCPAMWKLVEDVFKKPFSGRDAIHEEARLLTCLMHDLNPDGSAKVAS